jgi:hypothetical protein
VAFRPIADTAGWVVATGGTPAIESRRVLLAKALSDGSLSQAIDGAAMPIARADHASVVVREWLYVLGGANLDPGTSGENGVDLSDVGVTGIGPAGEVGSWKATTPLPSPRRWLAVAENGGRIYVAGGYDGAALSDVWFAGISNDGTLGGWRRASADLPAPRSSAHAAFVGNWMYVLGGTDREGVTWSDRVFVGRIDPSSGDVVRWDDVDSDAIVGPRRRFGFAVANSIFYVAGGEGIDGAALSTTEFAQADPQAGHLFR